MCSSNFEYMKFHSSYEYYYDLKIEDEYKNEDDLTNNDNLKNQDNFIDENYLKIKDNLKNDGDPKNYETYYRSARVQVLTSLNNFLMILYIKPFSCYI